MRNNLYNPMMPSASPMNGVVFGGGGGGGGQSQTTSGGLPEWAQQYAQQGLAEGFDLYEQGQFENVAGLTADQKAAQQGTRDLAGQAGQGFDTANQVYGDAATGGGVFGAGAYGNVQDQLKDQIAVGQQQALGDLQTQQGLGGGLGSARGEAAQARALTDTAANITAQEVAAQRQGALSGAQGSLGAAGQQFGQQQSANQALATSGQAQQQQAQNEADASYQGVQRLFGLLGSGALGQESTTTSSGGGGK